MGKYSVVHGGKVLDISFRKKGSFGPGSVTYRLYVGEEALGSVSRLSDRRGWDAFSYKGLDLDSDDPERVAANFMRVAEGFNTRYSAGEYLVQHWGYRTN